MACVGSLKYQCSACEAEQWVIEMSVSSAMKNKTVLFCFIAAIRVLCAVCCFVSCDNRQGLIRCVIGVQHNSIVLYYIVYTFISYSIRTYRDKWRISSS